MSWPDYEGKTVGFAKIMGELPLSDGSLAYEIMNFSITEEGFLESKFRLMPLIPDEWGGTSYGQPSEFLSGVLAMKHFKYDGESPELLFLTNDGVFRFLPGNRTDELPYGAGYQITGSAVPSTATLSTGSAGLQEERYWELGTPPSVSGSTTGVVADQNTPHSVVPQGTIEFPPQMENQKPSSCAYQQ